MAPTDVRDAGDIEWSVTSGISATNPIVSDTRTDYGGFDADHGRSRIVTTPEGQQGPAGAGAAMAAPDAPGVALLDSWRDLMNFKGSPMPWLLILAVLFLGFMQFRVDARARVGKRSAAASAALG
jgi:hypothetical protein